MAEVFETEEDRKESEALLRLLNSSSSLLTPHTHKHLPRLPKRPRPARSSSPAEYMSPSAIRRRASQAQSKLNTKSTRTPSVSRDVSYISESRPVKSIRQTSTNSQLLNILGTNQENEEVTLELPGTLNQLEASSTLPELTGMLEGISTTEFTSPLGKLHKRRDSSLPPASRKDVEVLAQWVEQMQASALAQYSATPVQLFHHTQLIYNTCLSQLVSQVSAQCLERGQLLEKVWKAYIGLFEKAIETYKAEKEGDDEKYLRSIARLNQQYGKQLMETRKQAKTQENRAEDLSLRVQVLQETLEKQCAKEERLIHKNQYLQSALESAEQHISSLESEISSLRKLMSGTIDDFKAGVPGSKAILQALSHSLSPMQMATEVFKHELTELIQPSLSTHHDMSSQVEIESLSIDTQTEIDDFISPLVDVGTEGKTEFAGFGEVQFNAKDSSEEDIWMMVLTDLNRVLETVNAANDGKIVLKNTHLKPILQKINTEIWVLSKKQHEKTAIWNRDREEFVREIERLRDLLAKKTQEAAETKAELQAIQHSLATNEKSFAGHSNESPRVSVKDNTHRSNTRRSPTKPHEFQLNRRNLVAVSDSHPSDALLENVRNGHNAATGFTQKSLLRHLITVWNDYLVQFRNSDSARNQTFISYIYDWHLMKYGLRKVAETKLQQVLSSLNRFSSSLPRLDWFSRLCGLQDKLSIEEIRFFVGLHEFLGKL